MSAFEPIKTVSTRLSALFTPGWRKTWRRRAAVLALSGTGSTSFAGCGSVAGPDYTGEVGLELRGEVVSSEGASANRVPVLAFLGEEEVYLMDGDIAGEFPSQFVFRVDEAPPASALRHFEDLPDVAVGFLAMAPKDHPATLTLQDAFWPSTVLDEVGDTDPETGTFTRTRSTCTADGEQCQKKTYACEAEPCEPLLEADGSTDTAPTKSGFECLGDACLTYSQSCDAESCSTKVAICEDGGPNDVISPDGSIDRCTLQSTEGQSPPIASLSGMFAVDLLVYFSTGDFAKDGVQIKQGYNLVQLVRADKQDWAESLLCRLDAEQDVWSNAGDATDEERRERLIEAEDQCPEAQRYEVVDDPSERQLTILLGDPSLAL